MDCSTPGSAVHGFSRQEYWSGLPCPPPGNLPDPGIEPGSPALQVDSLPSEPPGKPKEWQTLPADPQKLGEAGSTLPWSLEGAESPAHTLILDF